MRGRVGALVRGPWWIIRGAVHPDDLVAMYVSDMPEAEVADRIARAWLTQTPEQTARHRERTVVMYGPEAGPKFDKVVSRRT